MLETHNSQYSASVADSQMGETSGGGYLLTSSPVKQRYSLPSHESHPYESSYQPNAISTSPFSGGSATKTWDEGDDQATELPRLAPMRPNRRGVDDAVELGGMDHSSVSESSRGRRPNVNPVLYNFKSPIGTLSLLPRGNCLLKLTRFIDLMQYPLDESKNGSGSRNESRLTFNRR